MSEIPQFPISRFKYLKAEELKQMGSFDVTADGEYVCTVIVPQGEDVISSYAREHARQVAFQNNSVMPAGKQAKIIEELSRRQ